MSKEERLAELMHESKKIFLSEEQEKLSQAMLTLMEYRLYRGLKQGQELERFFHSLNGTSATLKLEDLSSIGKEYEDFLRAVNKSEGVSERVFLRILDGLSKVHEKLKELSKQDSCDSNNENLGDKKPHIKCFGKANILIVDEDQASVDLLERGLNDGGYYTLICSNTSEMEEVVGNEGVDLIVLDLLTVEKGDPGVLERLNDHGFNAPILFLHSNHSPKQGGTVLKTFADNYIEKPFKIEDIIARVEEELKKDGLKSEEKKKILLVDDMGVIIHMMQSHLSNLGYDVYCAKDGEEGIRKCKALKPDLMIADLMLPKVDGFEVCCQVKSDSQTKDTKIIVVSSKNKKGDVLKCFELGVDDYMIKPFSMLELEERIKKLI